MMITNRTLISSKTRSLKKQSGLTSVEFSIVGFATLTILFGCLEVSRMMFVVNLLEEATRRGARVAAVCTIDSDLIAQTAVFNSAGGANSTILPDLTTGNIQVEYLNETGGTIGNPAPVPGNTGFTDIRYVRVQIINYQHEMIIPGFDLSFMTRGYPTTIPSESLGIAPINQTSGC